MGSLRFDPNAQPQPQTPAAPIDSGGQRPGSLRFDPNNQPQPSTSDSAATGGQTGGGLQFNPNKGSVAGTGSWGDFANVAGNESMMNSLPGLRSQVEAARQRLGPNWSAAADFTGSVASPTSVLNMVPVVGPELAGGVHEGVRSYMSQPDWWPTPEARTQIAKDTAFGVATGGLGHGAAALAPKLLPEAAKWVATQAAPAGALAGYLHSLYGNIGVDVAGASGLFGLLNYPGNLVRSATEKIADQPATQTAIKLATQGAGAVLRASSPSSQWDQWVPWQ